MVRRYPLRRILQICCKLLIGACPTTFENGEVDRTKTTLFHGLLRCGHEKLTFEPGMVVMAETKSTEDPYLMTEEGLNWDFPYDPWAGTIPVRTKPL